MATPDEAAKRHLEDVRARASDILALPLKIVHKAIFLALVTYINGRNTASFFAGPGGSHFGHRNTKRASHLLHAVHIRHISLRHQALDEAFQ
jgi:hypothetical protein